MHAFTRLTSFLLFVLSLSLLTCALPTPAVSSGQDLAVRGGGADAILDALLELEAKLHEDVEALVVVQTAVDVTAKVEIIVGHVAACAHAIAAVGVKIDLEAEVKADIAAKVAAIISVIVHACLSVSIKFGIAVVLVIFAQIDLVLQLLLNSLAICVDGIVVLVAKIVADVCADVLVTLKFKLCLGVLAIVGL